jgi:hypothetical protein
VKESLGKLKEMNAINNRLKMILNELANLDERLHINASITVPNIRKVFILDGTGLSESFMNGLINYNICRRKAHIYIHFNDSTQRLM